MDCLTPEALEALTHPERPVVESRLREAPAHLGYRSGVPAPPAAKEVYGGVYENHLETANFTINWETGQGDAEAAARAGEALEAAWSYFVDDNGWTPPVSSERFYIWVLLVTDLSGTGLTTEYTTDLFPKGYPVIYLNSAWAGDQPFWASLAEHEFHHTLQYAVREWDGQGGGSETWYWEASATWAAGLVEPDSVALDYIVPWYGDRPEVRFDDTEGSHQYGMFVFNGWLDDTLGEGPGTMQAVWAAGTSAQDDPWDSILAATTQKPVGELFAGFGAAFANDQYARGAVWQDPASAPLEDGAEGAASYLGTRYYTAYKAGNVQIEALDASTALLSGPSAPRGSTDEWLVVEAGDRVAVTATTSPGARWVLHLAGPDTGDTGNPEEDTADSGATAGGDDPGEAPAGGCGCTTGGAAGTIVLALAAALAAGNRRRPRR